MSALLESPTVNNDFAADLFNRAVADLHKHFALNVLRRVMTRIHQGGSIYNNPERMSAYSVVARIASDIRRGVL